jgi:hypothetical protein
VDREPGVVGVLGSAHLDRKLELVGKCGSRGQSRAGVRLRGLSFLEEVRQRRQLVDLLVEAAGGGDGPLVAARLPENLLGFLRLAPEIGLSGLAGQRFERAPRGVQIKGSRGATAVAPRRLAGRR